ncbi:MAG TPA: PDZ domain-containing protein [Thermoanaerobaculia bacterium]|nr:PDZ domain-containing protein [Thermoanaerobaculia bacterium]
MIRKLLLSTVLLLTPDLLRAQDSAPEPPRCPKPAETCATELQQSLERRGVLGFLFSEVNADDQPPAGARFVVRSAPPGYPARQAGLREGDFLLAMNRMVLARETKESLTGRHRKVRLGETVAYQVLRDGRKLTVRVQAARPDPQSVNAWMSDHFRESHSPEEYRAYLRQLQSAARKSTGKP